MKKGKGLTLRMVRFLSLVLAVVLLVGMGFGCSTATTAPTTTSTTAKASPTTAATTLEPTPVPVTEFVIGAMMNPNVQDLDTNALTKKLEAFGKIDLKFEVYPSVAADTKTKINLQVASNTALPDIFSMPSTVFDDLTISDFAAKGIFTDLTKYFTPETAKYFYGISKLNNKFDTDYVVSNIKYNGKIYYLPSFVPSGWNESGFRAWVNKDWLTSFNLSQPKTTDDFYNMLYKFVFDDPNKNGKKDEIGYIGSNSGWGADVVPYIMNAFTYADVSKDYIAVDNGKLYAAYTLPEFRDGLEYLAKLTKEGLLSPLSFTQDDAQLRALCQQATAVTGVVASGSASAFGAATGAQAIRTDLLGPLQGPKGQKNVSTSPSLPGPGWIITKYCKNPKLAFTMGDYCYEPMVSHEARQGTKGVNWTDDPAQTAKFLTGYESQGLFTEYILISDVWGKPQNAHWQGVEPHINYASLYQNRGDIAKDAQSTGAVVSLATRAQTIFYGPDLFTPYLRPLKNNIGRITYSPEQLAEVATILTALKSCYKTFMTDFITGNRPISDWPVFQAELKKIGLDKYLTISQAAYDLSTKK